MKKAIMIGAGNIGRGFIGALLEKSGYHVTFADVMADLISEINTRKSYTVHVLDTVCSEFTVSEIDGISSANNEIIEAVKECDMITTAVGLRILPIVAKPVVAGIRERIKAGNTSFMNIIACENAVRATSQLKACVFEILNEDERMFCDKYIGFADCAVDKIVPKAKFDNPLDVAVESWAEWDVEKSGLRGNPGTIEGMTLVDNLQAYIERKLFSLNCGHAITAYLGKLAGKKTIYEASADSEIASVALGAMQESGAVLIRKFGFNPEKHAEYVKMVQGRFLNPHLVDEVERVGRDPLRKISPEDRLVKPMTLAESYGLPYDNLAKGVAAALKFRCEEDPSSIELNDYVCANGPEAALEKYASLKKSSPVSRKICEEYGKLK